MFLIPNVPNVYPTGNYSYLKVYTFLKHSVYRRIDDARQITRRFYHNCFQVPPLLSVAQSACVIITHITEFQGFEIDSGYPRPTPNESNNKCTK